MPNAIRIHHHGGPDALVFEPADLDPPLAGQARVRHSFAGVNFVDTYYRTGLYPLELPAVLGNEGVGRVVSVGAGVTVVKPGDRVGYASLLGAWATERNIAADRLVKLPETVSDETAAAVLLKGMTAEYLVRRVYPVRKGTTVLFHAAAGGVGSLACQWAKALGGRVIGAVSSPDKVAFAKANGCEQVVVTKQRNFVTDVKAFTGGAGVDVVYDSVGADTFDGSLASLRPRGMLVSFGQASGKVPVLDVARLGGERALFVTRPTLHAYTHTRAELEACAAALFEGLEKGWLKPPPARRFPLADAGQAMALLESRRTMGPMVLVVDEALGAAAAAAKPAKKAAAKKKPVAAPKTKRART